jgi:iron complex outermembrane receptor protein
MNLVLLALMCLQDPDPSKGPGPAKPQDSAKSQEAGKPPEAPKAQDAAKPSDPAKPQEPAQPPVPEREVVVIGERRPTDVQDVPSGLTVVTSDQIENTGATSIVEVLNKQPGFFSSGPNKGSYDMIVDIRGYNNGGGNGQRALVLVDGRKTNTVSGGFTDWASIPIDNIDRIEIVRGPASALYGDGALAGVVNIITKKGAEGVSGDVLVERGNWRTYKVAGNLSGGSQGVIYEVYAGAEGTDGWREHSQYAGDNLTARVEVPVVTHLRGYVKIGHHDDRRQEPGTIDQTEIETFGRRYSDPNNQGDTHVREDYADVGLSYSLGEWGDLSLFSDYTRRTADTFSFFFFGSIGTTAGTDESEIAMVQLKYVVTPSCLGKILTSTTGIDLSYELADATSETVHPVFAGREDNSYRRRIFGIYESIDVRPVPSVILAVSDRFDRALLDLDRQVLVGFGDTFSRLRTFDEWSPRVGLTWKMTDDLMVYGSWGKTFKLPTRDELVGFLVTDPGLDAEKATTFETGMRATVPRWVSAGVTLYHMVVSNELFFDSASFNEINLPKVTHEGLEFDARVTPLPWLELFGTYTFTKVTINEALTPSQEGNTYPVTPRNAATVGFTAQAEGASLTVLGRYAGRRYLINDLDNTGPLLPDYWVTDARVAYTWKLLTVFAAVYNISNRQYYDSAGFSGGGVRYNPAPDRSYLIGGEVKF